MENKRTVFSGLQPTGNVHIGNYLGALRNWVALQDDFEAIYCVVDLHAMTVSRDPATLRAERLEAAKIALALGVDPERSLLYIQSDVPQHSELAWILGTMTPTGVLNRMTQYKHKVAQGGEANLGLYAYPVLMAADILLHRAHLVPIGDDQKQHLEMTRDLAQRFNHRFGDTFPIPDALIPDEGARIMSLQNPVAKMSKSDPDDRSRILITDTPDAVRKKIRAAVTDSDSDVRYDPDGKPGISNLLEVMAACTGRPMSSLVGEFADLGYGRFKEVVAEVVIAELAPFRRTYESLDDHQVAQLLRSAAVDAQERAGAVMRNVRTCVGLPEI